MPSKLQHEINKLRGEVSDTGELYTSSIAALKDDLTDAEKDISGLDSEDENIISKVSSIKALATKALHSANASIKDGANGLIATLTFGVLRKLSAGSGVVKDEDGNNIFWFKDSINDSNISYRPIRVDTINEETNNAGVTIDTVLIKDGVVDGLDCSGVEASATADQTDAEIKTAIENASDLTIGSGFRISASQINRVDGDADDISMAFNYNGYQNGVTRFRDTVIYNGKHAIAVFIDGSSKDATFNGNIITTHNVDGRDLSVDGAKLDNIETAATADQTDAEIKTAFQNESVLTIGSGHINELQKLIFKDPIELVIDEDGAIVVTQTYHSLDTYGGGGSDNLVTINGGVDGQLLILTTEDSNRDVVLKHGTGNILLSGGDHTITDVYQHIMLIKGGGYWFRIN